MQPLPIERTDKDRRENEDKAAMCHEAQAAAAQLRLLATHHHANRVKVHHMTMAQHMREIAEQLDEVTRRARREKSSGQLRTRLL